MSGTQRRVVITGIGVVCPLGSSKESLWEALQSGRSGVGPMTVIPPGHLPIRFAAESPQFQGEIGDFGPLDKERTKAIRKGLKVMCRECQMGVAVAHLAMSDAGIVPSKLQSDRTGIVFGADYMLTMPEEFTVAVRQCLDSESSFEFSRWAKEGMPKMSPLWLLKYLPNMPASHIAIYNDFRGPNNSLTLREASSLAAVAEAYQVIRRDSADVMVVGATGTRLHPLKAVHSLQQEEVADGDGEPSRACRPFDRDRTGMVLGEGAGAIVVEELTHAQQRGAAIYGEISGATLSCCVGKRLIAQRQQAMVSVMRGVLRSAAVSPDMVGHVHAHGISTRSCDIEESLAINEVFRCREVPVPVVAAKSFFGNLGAGSGMVELGASLMAIKHGLLFPVLNYETPDPECPVAVVHGTQTSAGESFVSVNVTPQGQAAAVMVRQFQE